MEEDWEDHEEKGSPCETKRNETRLKFEITRTDVGNIAAAVVNMEEDEEIEEAPPPPPEGRCWS